MSFIVVLYLRILMNHWYCVKAQNMSELHVPVTNLVIVGFGAVLCRDHYFYENEVKITKWKSTL